jgi:hypothetical protein
MDRADRVGVMRWQRGCLAPKKRRKVMAQKQLDEELLKGITFRGAEKKEVEENGIKKEKWFPTERKAVLDDVLDWRDLGPEVSIVIADGRKHRVKKPGKKAA